MYLNDITVGDLLNIVSLTPEAGAIRVSCSKSGVRSNVLIVLPTEVPSCDKTGNGSSVLIGVGPYLIISSRLGSHMLQESESMEIAINST